VLGVDEHTALVFDLDEGDATVTGRGVVTVRRRGVAERFPAGTRMPMTLLVAAAQGAREAGGAAASIPAAVRAPAEREEPRPKRSALLDEVARLEQAFVAALAARRAGEAAEAILALDRAILDWSADTLQTDEPDRARAVLHSLVHRLGEAASVGLRDPKEVLAPLVEGLIGLRAELRTEKAWQVADRLRDRLVAGGIELHDTPGGTTWTLRD
jgi:cysteinyl-tRNA synthetase